jgi:glycosyltransferase involved in cell wall biosynthesis
MSDRKVARSSILWGEVYWNHIGMHSGLRPLSRWIDSRRPGEVRLISSIPRASGPLSTLKRKLSNLLDPYPEWLRIHNSALPLYSAESWRLEEAIGKAVATREPDLVVLEGVDEHFFKLATQRPRWRRTKIVGISHQPPAWVRLRQRQPEVAKSLDALVVFSSAAREFWAPIVGLQKTHFLRHGVSTEFFSPAEPRPRSGGALRILFCGHWLRDFGTLAEVVSGTESRRLDVVFDFVVPHKARDASECYRLALSPLVRWHAGLSDDGLRDLYRQSDLVLLPLEDATANNTLLEGAACGLPAIVTDVGGVRDYATEEFADFVPRYDAGAILALLTRYAANRELLPARGKAARSHAEAMLSWRESASQFDRLLCSLMKPGPANPTPSSPI